MSELAGEEDSKRASAIDCALCERLKCLGQWNSERAIEESVID